MGGGISKLMRPSTLQSVQNKSASQHCCSHILQAEVCLLSTHLNIILGAASSTLILFGGSGTTTNSYTIVELTVKKNVNSSTVISVMICLNSFNFFSFINLLGFGDIIIPHGLNLTLTRHLFSQLFAYLQGLAAIRAIHKYRLTCTHMLIPSAILRNDGIAPCFKIRCTWIFSNGSTFLLSNL